jgi:ClpP class serine protease
MNLMSQVSGGTSTELFARDVKAALNDPAVQSIVLLVDSPGGAVGGTMAAAAAVMTGRGVKPIAAYSDGTMASAAYWVGSAADRVYVSSGVDQVGSIGVVASHVDVSQREQALGIKTTEIVAGSYKRIASSPNPAGSPFKFRWTTSTPCSSVTLPPSAASPLRRCWPTWPTAGCLSASSPSTQDWWMVSLAWMM